MSVFTGDLSFADASKSTELDGTNCLSVVIRASARRTPLADTNRVTPVPARVSLLILSFAPLFLAVGFIQIVLGAWLAGHVTRPG